MNIEFINGSDIFLKEMLSKELDHKYLRIDIEGFTWSGPEFTCVLDEQTEEDTIYEFKGLSFVMSNDIESLSNEFKIILDSSGVVKIETPLNSTGC